MAVEAALALAAGPRTGRCTIPRFFAVHRADTIPGISGSPSHRSSPGPIPARADRRVADIGLGEIPASRDRLGTSWTNGRRKAAGAAWYASSSLSRLLTAERGILTVIHGSLSTRTSWPGPMPGVTIGRWPTKTSGDIPGLGGVN